MRIKIPCILWYTLHTYGFIVCLYSNTPLHNDIFVKFSKKSCKGPGFVESDEESPMLQNDFFCDECHLCPPLRASHCKECKHCVLRRDHHCPWIGTCVGMNNHLYFILFLFFDIITLVQYIHQTWKAALEENDFIIWIFTNFMCGVVCVSSAFALFQTIVQFPVQVFYACLNKTTWESAKAERISYLRNWRYDLSPFSHGIIRNLKEFLTMHKNHPKYKIPTEDEIEEWKKDNSFLANDKYSCC